MVKEAIFPGGPPTSTFGIRSGKKSTKGMPHGDGGRALKKAEKRINELQKKMKTAPAKERKKIQKKINDIRSAALKKDKGETPLELILITIKFTLLACCLLTIYKKDK